MLATMIIGNLMLFFPVCILQPALVFGIAFSNLSKVAFLPSKIILIHTVYGLGLYGTALGLKHHQKRLQKVTIIK